MCLGNERRHPGSINDFLLSSNGGRYVPSYPWLLDAHVNFDACIYCRETSIQVGRLVFDDILEVSECVLAAMKLVNTMPPVGLVSGMGR